MEHKTYTTVRVNNKPIDQSIKIHTVYNILYVATTKYNKGTYKHNIITIVWGMSGMLHVDKVA